MLCTYNKYANCKLYYVLRYYIIVVDCYGYHHRAVAMVYYYILLILLTINIKTYVLTYFLSKYITIEII